MVLPMRAELNVVRDPGGDTAVLSAPFLRKATIVEAMRFMARGNPSKAVAIMVCRESARETEPQRVHRMPQFVSIDVFCGGLIGPNTLGFDRPYTPIGIAEQ